MSGGNSVERWRLWVLLILVAVLLFVFWLKIFNLQISQGLEFLEKANRISLQTRTVPAQRGIIYDRNGEPLVFHEDLFAIHITPSEVRRDELEEVKERLGELLKLSNGVLNRRVPKGSRGSTPLEVKDGVPFQVMAYIAENKELFPSVSWEGRAKRVYSDEASIAHVLGYVSEISGDELQFLYNEGYRAGDKIGKAGIERQYDSLLRGKTGQQFFTVDARGGRVGEQVESFVPPMNGADLYLTIDMNVQRLASDALGDRRGSVVVMKPATGEIIAMVSKPVFNANTFDSRGPDSLGSQILNPSFPFINRTISAVYPAASLFKIITETAILENNSVSPERTVFCPGYIEVRSQRYYCHNKSGHGHQNLRDALANSCNVYFWTIAKDFVGKDKLGRADPIRIAEQARDFGLGMITEIDLPGEKEGLIPDKDWKEDTYNSLWAGGDTMNMAIGQGFVLVTPLQMANVASMVTNKGIIYRPHVLREVRDRGRMTVERRLPEVLHTASISEATWQRLGEDLRYTVTNGTGWVLTRTRPVAGKTGTGEIGVEGQYHDWFLAYAPYGEDADPEDKIVVVVQIEPSGLRHQWWSSKIADHIIQGYYAQQTYKEVIGTLRPWYLDWRAISGFMIERVNSANLIDYSTFPIISEIALDE